MHGVDGGMIDGIVCPTWPIGASIHGGPTSLVATQQTSSETPFETKLYNDEKVYGTGD